MAPRRRGWTRPNGLPGTEPWASATNSGCASPRAKPGSLDSTAGRACMTLQQDQSEIVVQEQAILATPTPDLVEEQEQRPDSRQSSRGSDRGRETALAEQLTVRGRGLRRPVGVGE